MGLGRTSRKLACAVAALLTAAVAAGCTLPAPPGDAPLRYRDQVFGDVGVTKGVVYGQNTGRDGTPEQLALDVYQPTGDTAGRRPAIVWMHGGGFYGGTRDSSDMVTLSTRFAKRGYVAVSISYRLLAATPCVGSNPGPCAIAAIGAQEDEKAAVRYLRAHAAELRIDPDRIAIAGSSAGAVASSIYGQTQDVPGDSGNPGSSQKVAGVVSISGGVPNNTFVTADDAPVLFLHGTADPIVPFAWAQNNTAALLQVGVPAILHQYDGAGHVPYQYIDDMDQQATYFLYGVMDLKHAEASGVAPAAAPRRLSSARTVPSAGALTRAFTPAR